MTFGPSSSGPPSRALARHDYKMSGGPDRPRGASTGRILMVLMALGAIGGMSGCGAAAHPSLSGASTCADWAAASPSGRAVYVAASEPTITPVTVAGVVDRVNWNCGLPDGPFPPLTLNQTVMNNTVAAVGQPPSIPAPPPLASNHGAGILGDTVEEWNAAHVLDPSLPASSSFYDPTPKLVSNPSANESGDRFFMSAANGRVNFLDVTLNPNSSIKRAIAQVLKTLPNDTTAQSSLAPSGVCMLMDASSPTLQQELGSTSVLVTFSSGAGGNAPYDPTSVTDAVVDAGQTSGSSGSSAC